jgi:hypothetical protein
MGLVDKLWNAEVGPDNYRPENEKYQNAILEQYKIYVEMADRISARRAMANTFFLTLNTSIFTVFGVFLSAGIAVADWRLFVPLIALVAECGAWFYIVRSYRQLNRAKYRVVGALEERLPSSPYWNAEWFELGEGRDRKKYWQLTHVEQIVPIIFAVVYVLGFVLAVTA